MKWCIKGPWTPPTNNRCGPSGAGTRTARFHPLPFARCTESAADMWLDCELQSQKGGIALPSDGKKKVGTF